ncbi:potassium channel family protein [Streptomyces katsurahamanus]|uniref:Two pore domain potassium channel family protein n=1 Tax=Streptomyces katsurahamanus TaxID=2577098 RepID=A0ABW9P0M7_9ACTN|nr:potassium channel family protein [Streptomyces katsurahamanus]MQS38969.1 two pore domain potassium channel family protein [Streptomyces katsurahamanus]
MDEENGQSRWRRRTELPLFLASLLYLFCYAVRVLAEGLSEGWRDVLLAVTYALWSLFLIDYLVRWRLSGQGLSYVRRHVMDAIVVLLPLLRPLRVVRIYETVRHRHAHARLTLYARVIAYASMSAVLLGFAGALTVYSAEHDAPGATITTFGDSVWWTCSTLTTVGYGDITPVTPMGRTVAVAMMAGGMALLGAVTGSFSSWVIQTFTLDEDREPPGP